MLPQMKILSLAFSVACLNCAIAADYGVDVSFPIHGPIKDATSHFYKRYMESMEGCYQLSSKADCDSTERARIEMNLDQPRTQHNYTEIGFKKTRLPADLFEEILQFYEENKDKKKLERWGKGNTYINNWVSPPYMISLEEKSLRGSRLLKQKIWDTVKPIISEWVGKELIESSLYGIRVYSDQAILATHVDRMPLVSSCIIQVAQDVDEPWPVEVIAHDGTAHNVTMVPGDMVLYESHSVLHGRPFPLVGRSYANIFVHYIPVDHDDMNEKDHEVAEVAEERKTVSKMKAVAAKAALARNRDIGGHEHDNHDEANVRKHRADIDREEKEETERTARQAKNVEEEVEEEEEEDGEMIKQQKIVDGMTALHMAASEGDLVGVISLLKSFDSGSVSGSANYDMIHARDANGWQAIHEAAARGHLEVLKFLVDKGADVGAMTKEGGTVLWWARESLESGDPVISYLEEINAPEHETPMYP